MIVKLLKGVLLAGILLLSSCRQSSFHLERVEGQLITIDSVFDQAPDQRYVNVLKPYKTTVDSVMNRVIGICEVTLKADRPESTLSNLVADVMRDAATRVQEKPADMGLVNVGGIRNILTAGEITCGNVYEVLPFENILCVVSLKGSDLKQLFEEIAKSNGEGVSGVQLQITADGKLESATINNRPVDDEKIYTIATIDYLADGNDNMMALQKAQERKCIENGTIRDIFMDYVEQQTKAGKKITARMEGRITVKPK